MSRGILALTAFAALALVACPKKKEEVVDAAPAPTPTPVQTAVEDLKAMVEEDAGSDAAADADAAKKPGVAGNANVARLKMCCAQLAAEGKRMGASVEAGMLMGAAAQCNALAAQVGSNGNAAELGVIRNMLKGRTVPPVCQGF